MPRKTHAWLRVGTVATILWIVAAGAYLMVDYYRLDSDREPSFGIPRPPSGFVLEPKTTSTWFRWAVPDDPAAFQPEIRMRWGRVASLLVVPGVVLWIAGSGALWIRAGFASPSGEAKR